MEILGRIIGHPLPPLDEFLAQCAQGMGLWFYLLLFAVIFSETGLVVAPFLPGDSLLFAVGALAAVGGASLPTVLILLTFAAVLGDAVNYAVGYRVGPAVFRSDKSRLFNRKHLLRAQAFYEKYGNKTIILARFVPIVRTFAPFVAGIGKMQYRRFAIYNVIGGLAWVLICTLSGYWFGTIDWVKRHFEAVAGMIVLLSIVPMVVELVLERRRMALERLRTVPLPPEAEPQPLSDRIAM